MKRKIKPIIGTVIVVLILLGIAFVSLASDTQKMQEKLNTENVLNLGATENDVSKTDYTLMLENDSLQFLINNDTTEFKVINKKTGAQWSSSNPESSPGTSEIAPMTLSYLNSQGSLADMNIFEDSISDGKFSVSQDGDRVTVKYSVGDFSELSLIPYALTEERFEEVMSHLEDEFQQMKLTDLYYLTDIDIIEDPDLKKDRLANYPYLAEQKLYIIRDTTRDDPLAKRDVAKIFADAGYTDEDYEADSKYFSASDTAKAAPGFNITVEYSLDGDCLCVNIPYDGIEMYNDFPLTSLTFAPFFGSPERGAEGWFLLPDGSGSLMNYYKSRASGQIYRTGVYGNDHTEAERENLSNDPGASLPVFGIRHNGDGVLCEITGGAAIADIEAYPGDATDKAYAHAVFNVRAAYKSTASTGRKEAFVIVQKIRYAGDIGLKYHFLGNKDVSLADMANVTAECVFGDTQSRASGSTPVMLTDVGLIARKNQFLGISYNEKVRLTDFDSVCDIADAFTQAGVDDLSVRLTGWFGEGVGHKYLSGKVSPSGLLGGKSGFRSMIDALAAKNISLYLDGDVQYTAKTAAFDGFSTKSDAVTMLNQATGRVTEYGLASFVREYNQGSARYINNIDAQKKAISSLASSAENYGVKGLSLRLFASELAADYGNPTIDRQAAADEASARLKELCDKGYNIISEGANAYALPYIKSALEVPVTSAGSDMTDTAVPFLQMVIGGRVDYYAPAINLSGDVQTAILHAVSTGSGFSCTLSSQNNEKITDSNQNELYSTDFEYWKDTLPKKIAECREKLKPVSGRKIVDFAELRQGVTKTVYDNGAEVIVNFNNEPYQYGSLSINAKDFNVTGVRS